MLIGYARTSIGTELLRNQINVLEKVGCTKIFKDVSNDGTLKDLGLCRAQSALKPGDKLVVCKLDRLGRGVKRLISLIAELQEQGCHFQSVDDGLDTTGADGSCLKPGVSRAFFFFVARPDALLHRGAGRASISVLRTALNTP